MFRITFEIKSNKSHRCYTTPPKTTTIMGNIMRKIRKVTNPSATRTSPPPTPTTPRIWRRSVSPQRFYSFEPNGIPRQIYPQHQRRAQRSAPSRSPSPPSYRNSDPTRYAPTRVNWTRYRVARRSPTPTTPPRRSPTPPRAQTPPAPLTPRTRTPPVNIVQPQGYQQPPRVQQRDESRFQRHYIDDSVMNNNRDPAQPTAPIRVRSPQRVLSRDNLDRISPEQLNAILPAQNFTSVISYERLPTSVYSQVNRQLQELRDNDIISQTDQQNMQRNLMAPDRTDSQTRTLLSDILLRGDPQQRQLLVEAWHQLQSANAATNVELQPEQESDIQPHTDHTYAMLPPRRDGQERVLLTVADLNAATTPILRPARLNYHVSVLPPPEPERALPHPDINDNTISLLNIQERTQAELDHLSQLQLEYQRELRTAASSSSSSKSESPPPPLEITSQAGNAELTETELLDSDVNTHSRRQVAVTSWRSMKRYNHRLENNELTFIVPNDFIWTATYQRRLDQLIPAITRQFPQTSQAFKYERIITRLQNYINILENCQIGYNLYKDIHRCDERPIVTKLETTEL